MVPENIHTPPQRELEIRRDGGSKPEIPEGKGIGWLKHFPYSQIPKITWYRLGGSSRRDKIIILVELSNKFLFSGQKCF